MASSPERWFTQVPELAATIMQSGVWIISLVGSFLIPPPEWMPLDDKIWLNLSQFIITVLIGLMFLIARRRNELKHIKWWGISSAILLVFSICLFLGYQYLSSTLTCDYLTKKIIVGFEYTKQAQIYIDKNPNLIENCNELIMDFAGKSEDIWTRKSINLNRIKLATAYIGTLPFFALCLITMIQAVSITETKRLIN